MIGCKASHSVSYSYTLFCLAVTNLGGWSLQILLGGTGAFGQRFVRACGCLAAVLQGLVQIESLELRDVNRWCLPSPMPQLAGMTQLTQLKLLLQSPGFFTVSGARPENVSVLSACGLGCLSSSIALVSTGIKHSEMVLSIHVDLEVSKRNCSSVRI
jgi:hypothetical protein